MISVFEKWSLVLFGIWDHWKGKTLVAYENIKIKINMCDPDLHGLFTPYKIVISKNIKTDLKNDE